MDRRFVLPAVLALAACSTNEANEKAKARIWGNEKVPSEVEQRAKQTLPADVLEADASVRRRVFEMEFEEVVARMGFVRYEGAARLSMSRLEQKLSVVEDSLIEQGLHGGFRALQKDADGKVTREAVYHNGILFIRNGAGGKMRVQGIVKDQHKVIREEAWQPLRTFLAYYGARAGLKKSGPARSGDRDATAYALVLLDGPELIRNNAIDKPKKPLELKGKLVVDDQTGVPLEVKLTGKLEVPSDKENVAPGIIELSLEGKLATIEGREIKPGEFVPTIERHPTDLDPLAFLEGDTRTSTTIGGKKAANKGASPKAEEAQKADAPAAPKPAADAAPKKNAP